MPTIRSVGPQARARLATRGHAQLRPYLESIAGLTGDQTLEFEPEHGETLRMVRVRVGRAARQLAKTITCGTTEEGTLLIWLAEPTPARRPGRRRRTRDAGNDQPREIQSEPPLGEVPP